MDADVILNCIDQIFRSHPELTGDSEELRKHLQQLLDENKHLRNELERFRSYVENASDTIAIFDLEGRVTYSTQNWFSQLGYELEEIVNSRIFERFMHPEDAPKSQAFFDKAVSTKKSQSGIEYRIRHKDGSWRWHTANISPILNDQGEVESIVAIARSIHQQKTAELLVRESESRLRVILDTMREGVIMVDNDDRILFINQSLCDMYGFKAGDVLGKYGFSVLVIEEDQHIILEKNKIREAGMVDDYEVRGRKMNGELIWLHISGAPLKNDEGKVIGSVGIMSDITLRRKTIDALRQSEEKFRHLFENSIAGVFQSSFNDVYLNVNPAFAKMFGYDSPQEMIRDVSSIKNIYVNPEDRENLKQILVQEGSVENYEVHLKRKDNSQIWVSLFAKLANDKTGGMIIEGTCLDITESKSLREQLLASQKMEAIGKLAGGIAHDFNNLLTVILGYSEDILEDINPDSRLYEPAEEIVKAGLRAATLTRQLLAFSRKQLIHNEEINFNNLVNNLRGIISRLIGEEVEVDIQLSDDLNYVKADPGQIEQVLINMVINAKEAMPTGGHLSIRTANELVDSSYAETHPRLHEGEYVLLSVSDTGCGMDKATLEHIFEPFFTTKTDTKSVGLGLASAYGIIEQANGVITVYSEPGRGTTMRVLLPALKLNTEARPVQYTIVPTGKGQRILVVEDEEALGRMVQRMISALGYSVECTHSSLKALQRFQNNEHFDLVVTDVVMPNMNGKELSDAILEINPQQKILFMSGFADDVIAQHGILDPSLPFIQKPFSSKTIAPIIFKLLGNAKSQLQLMIIDDEIGICKLFQRSCEKRGHRCDKACKIGDALSLVGSKQYDMLLVDMNLSDCTGIEAIRMIRQKGCNAPAILLSGMLQPGMYDNMDDLGIVRAFEKSFDNAPLLKLIEDYFQTK